MTPGRPVCTLACSDCAVLQVAEAARIELNRVVEELITGEDECTPLIIKNVSYILCMCAR
jgi:hypothetical protein